MQWLIEDIQLMIANTFKPVENSSNIPPSLSKTEERQALFRFNKIILKIAESKKINETLFFSKRLQKEFIRNLFSSGVETSLKSLSKWRYDLLYEDVQSLYSEYK